MSTAVAGTTSASTSFRPTRSYTNTRDVTRPRYVKLRLPCAADASTTFPDALGRPCAEPPDPPRSTHRHLAAQGVSSGVRAAPATGPSARGPTATEARSRGGAEPQALI